MLAKDIKTKQAFIRAIKPWQRKHRSAAGPIMPSNEFKLLKSDNKLYFILDSGDKPGSFCVCALSPKYLRSIVLMKTGTIVKTDQPYKVRRKGLDAVFDDMDSANWIEGTYRGSECLFTSDPHLFIAFASKIERQSIKELIPVLQDAYTRANALYHTGAEGESFLTDSEFDALEAILQSNKALPTGKREVGAPVNSARKVKLPNVMPSLEFEKTPEAIKSWAKKHKLTTFVYSPKIDGISIQLIYKKGQLFQAFTRGDGEEAEDKTHIAKACPNIPQTLTRLIDLECRVEAYMEEDVFKKKYWKNAPNAKYNFTSARACVAGMFNRKVPDKDILKDIKVYAFEVFKGFNSATKTRMLFQLQNLGFQTVPLTTISSSKFDSLPKDLASMRAQSKVAMDGLVLEVDDLNKREEIGNETNSLNPAWAKAFKPSKDGVLAEVVRVEWNVSPHGYLKPIVYVKEVKG